MVACKYPQVRNYATGRCRTPCKNHQAINPATGRCVTKTYLKALRHNGDLTDSEYRSTIRDDGITRRSDYLAKRRSGYSGKTRDEFSAYGDFDYSEFEYKEPRKSAYGYGRSAYGYGRRARGRGRDNAHDLRDMLVADKHCYPP